MISKLTTMLVCLYKALGKKDDGDIKGNRLETYKLAMVFERGMGDNRIVNPAVPGIFLDGD